MEYESIGLAFEPILGYLHIVVLNTLDGKRIVMPA